MKKRKILVTAMHIGSVTIRITVCEVAVRVLVGFGVGVGVEHLSLSPPHPGGLMGQVLKNQTQNFRTACFKSQKGDLK